MEEYSDSLLHPDGPCSPTRRRLPFSPQESAPSQGLVPGAVLSPASHLRGKWDRVITERGRMVTWEPPMTVEERLKAAVVPGRLELKYHLARERAHGEQEIGLVPFLADRRRISLDVGANKGIWSEALRCCSRQVHAFEPNPKIFRVLKRGLGAGVVAHQAALSDASGTAELRVPKGRRGYSNQGASLSRVKIGAAEYGSVRVDVCRLDDLDLGDVGFMKIDVEGHELAVLEGARETIRRCRPNMIVEIEEKHMKRPIAELLATVCSYGYEAHALDGGALRRASLIDLSARHSKAAGRDDYIFNWIFLPA